MQGLSPALPGTSPRPSRLTPPLPACAVRCAWTVADQECVAQSLDARCRFFLVPPAPACCSLRRRRAVPPETPATVRPSRRLPEHAPAENCSEPLLPIHCASLYDIRQSLQGIPDRRLYIHNKRFQEIQSDTAAVLFPPQKLPKDCGPAAHLYICILYPSLSDPVLHQSNNHNNIHNSVAGIRVPAPVDKSASHRISSRYESVQYSVYQTFFASARHKKE